MSKARQASSRILKQVPMSHLLYTYGYSVIDDGNQREQQFSCDLHGDGSDTKPSARLYPDSNKFYCFACGKVRDPVSFLMEKESLPFWRAVNNLESSYNLPHIDWSEETQPKDTLQSVFEVDHTLTPMDNLQRVQTLLQASYVDDLDSYTIVRLWEAHDKVLFYLQQGELEESVAKKLSVQVLQSVKEFCS